MVYLNITNALSLFWIPARAPRFVITHDKPWDLAGMTSYGTACEALAYMPIPRINHVPQGSPSDGNLRQIPPTHLIAGFLSDFLTICCQVYSQQFEIQSYASGQIPLIKTGLQR